jgi:succinyl-diaminopimelate desuccinylase
MHDLAGQEDVRIRFLCVPDEESEDIERRTSDELVRRGFVGDFAITGEPTDLHVGVQAKGVLACRIAVHGRAAHSSTPWLGDNAVLKAIDVFRRIESMPFSRESSEMFDRPSINLGRIVGGDAVNKVPDECVMDVDIRYLPNQDPDDILGQIRGIDDMEIRRTFVFPPAYVSRSNPYVVALCRVVSGEAGPEQSVSVGRDGASDAVAFLKAGIPAVEFGPSGAGHHGPEEWVSVPSLRRYREALVRFASGLAAAPARLEAVDGGRAA